MSATAVRLSMPKKRGLEPKEDHDYEPYDSFDEDERIKQQGGSVSQLLRSSRGRLVKARNYFCISLCFFPDFITTIESLALSR